LFITFSFEALRVKRNLNFKKTMAIETNMKNSTTKENISTTKKTV
jgi:hypothetical protein